MFHIHPPPPPPLNRISSRNSTHIIIQPRAYVTLHNPCLVTSADLPKVTITDIPMGRLIHAMNDIHIPSPYRLTNTQCNFQWVSKSRVTLDSYHSTLSLRDNHDLSFSSRVTPDSYHSTLSLRDNMTVCFISRET